MTDEEIAEHAQRIAQDALEDLEYSYVYEDEALEDTSEEDWQRIHRAIQRQAKVTIRREEG